MWSQRLVFLIKCPTFNIHFDIKGKGRMAKKSHSLDQIIYNHLNNIQEFSKTVNIALRLAKIKKMRMYYILLNKGFDNLNEVCQSAFQSDFRQCKKSPEKEKK